MATAGTTLTPRKDVLPVFFWCLPALGGFVLFLFSFPIDRQIPFWPSLSIAELFTLWFLFITPVTTVVAIIVLIKRRKIIHLPRFFRFFAWSAIVTSVLLNAFVLVGMWAASY